VHLQSTICVVVLAFCVLMTGCLVMPLPGSKQIEGAAGAPEKKKVDLTFLKTGQTGRDEVLQKLGWANAGIKNDRLFLARWISSHEWGWFIAGNTGSAGGGGRFSEKMHNLLVQFDEKGVVQQVRQVPTGKLVEEFRNWIVQEQGPPLELSTAVQLEIQHHHADSREQFESVELGLTKDSFVFHELGNAKHDFRIAPEKIARINVGGAINESSKPNLEGLTRLNDPSSLRVTIRFSEKTAAGGKMTLQTTPSDLFVLVEYLQQVRPSALPKTQTR